MKKSIVAAILSLAAALPVAAQNPERSLTREILDRAKTALFDLQYAAADSIARDVLSLGVLSRAARIEALQVIAAANYPESMDNRREAQARSALSQLARIDLALTMPRELASRALDSLYREVLSSTFSISVLVRRENAILGIEGASLLRVRTNRPASFTLHARSRDGIESVLLDSVSVSSDTTLQLRVSRNGRTIVRPGEYDFVITATDVGTREAVTRTFEGVAIVPPFELLATRPTVDSSQLKPERSPPEKTSGMVAGVILGAGTIALGNGLRSSGPIGHQNYADNRHIGIGVLLALGAATAAWFDKGRTLEKNVAANRATLARLTTEARGATDENARRAREYRASITLNTEWR